MTRHRTIVLVAVTIFGVSVSFARAQIVVTDPATTIKNAAIALLKNDVVDLLTNQATRLRKMAKRLSLATNLDKYSLPDPPAWRIHWFIDDGTFLYANPYTAALNYGDGTGRSFEEVARERVAPGAELAGIGGAGEDAAALDVIASEVATLDVADSTIIAGTDQNGQLRQGRRRVVTQIVGGRGYDSRTDTFALETRHALPPAERDEVGPCVPFRRPSLSLGRCSSVSTRSAGRLALRGSGVDAGLRAGFGIAITAGWAG